MTSSTSRTICIHRTGRVSGALLTLAMWSAPLSAQDPARHTLMPVPSSVMLSGERLIVDSTFRVSVRGARDGRLERGISRAVARLEMRIGVPLSRQYPSDSSGTLVVNVASPGRVIPELGDDESYALAVDGRHAVLTAANDVGALRGLETLLQLQTTVEGSRFLQGADIHDTPRFRWRGLLLDVSRHFEPVDVVKRTLDGMAMVKLNVLHWHLSDDQGFRVESKKLPRLHQFGSDSLFYTQEEIRDVVAYAADRGIRVMPEFDVPGHTSSWFVGDPELTVGSGPFTIARRWGTFEPTMDPTRESTYTALDQFIGEMTTLFPDKYWHVGGDEVNPAQWKGTASIQAYMKAHNIPSEVALHTAFNKRLFDIVQKHGRTPVGWDEIFQPGLPTTAVIQSWQSTTALAASAKAGFHGILSAPYYIDHMKTAAEFYTPDPIPANTTMTATEQAMVLGGEACIWAEYVTPEILDSRIWPRLAAVAERLWSPASVTDIGDMYRRLDVTSRRLAELGLHHEDHIAHMVTHFAGDSTALFTEFLGYVRPMDFGGNGPTQFYPHTALADAALPDPRPGRELTVLARRAVAGDSVAAAALRGRFVLMMSFRDRLRAVRPTLPAAADGDSVAALLYNIGRTGLQAVDILRKQGTAPAGWPGAADSLLTASAGRTRVLRPVGAEAVRLLLGITR